MQGFLYLLFIIIIIIPSLRLAPKNAIFGGRRRKKKSLTL